MDKSQEQIASDSEDTITQTTVSRVERGLIHPVDDLSARELYTLIRALQWTPEEFTIATGIQLPGITMDAHTGRVEILTAEELEEFKAVNRDLERLEEFTGGDLLKRIQGAKKSIGRLLKMISRGVLA